MERGKRGNASTGGAFNAWRNWGGVSEKQKLLDPNRRYNDSLQKREKVKEETKSGMTWRQ
jgi:hypothetical protein